VARACQRQLQAHVGDSKALHSFVDVLDRLPIDVLQECRSAEAKAMSDMKLLADRLSHGLTSKTEVQDTRSKLGTEYVAALSGILSVCKFKDKVWCERLVARSALSTHAPTTSSRTAYGVNPQAPRVARFHP
jgi:hypothetical protein